MPGALVFGANTSDRVDFGSPAACDDLDPFTYLVWVFPTTLTGNRCFVAKSSNVSVGKVFNLGGTASRMNLAVSRATTSTSYQSASSTVTTGAWQLLAVSFNSAAGAGLVGRMYRGTVGALATEVTYAVQTDGSGAVTTDAAETLFVGNHAALILAIQGRIGVAAVFGAELTLAQIQSWQRRPRKTVGANVAKMFTRLGKYGADAIEYTGLTGTVTGATQGDGVPLLQDDNSYVGTADQSGRAA